jgi:tetratricopeptide (TPR) repeat protein
MPASTAPVSQYTRQEASRILSVPHQQIVAWQRAGLVESPAHFSIRDLARLRSLRDLRRQQLSVQSIRRSVQAMQLSGVADPLRDSHAVSSGPRLVFRHGGALLDPLTQQLGFDWDASQRGDGSLIHMEQPREQQMRDQARAQETFQRAVQLEERPESLAEAESLYREVLQTWPRHAAASINLGTILYNSRRFAEAEQRYRAAAEIDPDYALAFFDLGNVLDEMRRLPEAIAAYTRAIQLVPQYADAHYNLALAYERVGERRRALRHWLCYVRLDPVGPWATHARMQARRTLATERLSIVTRGGKLAGKLAG